MKKSTKVELVSAIAMLLVAAIMMTSASFAWFTLSTTPEVSNVEMSLGASKNFEIARATTGIWSTDNIPEVTSNDAVNENQTTWGGRVSSFSASANKITYGIHLNGSTMQAIQYNADGRTSGAYIDLTTTYGAMSDGVLPIGAQVSYMDETYPETVGVGYGVWLRSNVKITSMAIDLTTSGAFVTTNGSVTYSSITVDGKTINVGDMLNISVKVFKTALGTNDETGWNALFNGNAEGIATDGTATQLSVPKEANTAFLAVVIISVDGEYLFAKDYVEENGLTFNGFEVEFSSPQIS